MQDLVPLKTFLDAKYPGLIANLSMMPDGARALRYKSAATDNDMTAIQADADAFVFPAPLDLNRFEDTVFHDPTIPFAAKLPIIQLIQIMRTRPRSTGDIKGTWAGLMSEIGTSAQYLGLTCSDNVVVHTKIEGIAADCGVILV